MGILGGTLQSLGGGFAGLGNVVQGFAAGGVAGAAITAIGEVTKGLQWSVEEAKQSEQAIKNLSIAVEKSGTAWDSVKEGTLSALSNLQKFTVYSDEQLAATLQRLLTFGMSYDEAMKALGTATDLAAAKNIDLESAAGLVGKAFMGNTAILQRYGIDIQTSKEATTALKDAVATVAEGIKASGDNLAGFSSTLAEAGVSLTTTEGKMRGAKDIAEELIGAFQSGTIDAESFDQIMGELGVTIDTSKLKAADFPAVMSALNEQFGGTAQEQAKTYAGIQERLKNATSDLGEKIGGMLLPALAGMTEAMIPVVDGLGKGVDAIGSWLTEVGKMPEVKGFVEAAQGAFDGLWKAMEDFWGFLAETFGPVLQELGGALKEVFDALAPIGQAFGEVWAAITGGQEGGDWLKDLLKFVAQFIREVVVPAIKEAVHVIKGFADAFKAAADFALPIITQIKDAVVGFINALKDAFYGFYTWLVGGSLWMDLWNALLSVASTMIGTLLGDLGSKLFEPIKNAFTGAMQAVEDLWNKGWDAVQTGFTTYVDNFIPNLTAWGDFLKTNVTSFTDAVKSTWDTSWGAIQRSFNTITSQIQTGLNTRFNEMKSFVTANMGEYAPIANLALTNMENVTNAVLAIMRGDWNSALTYIGNAISGGMQFWQNIMTGAMNSLQGASQAGVNAISTIWNGLVSVANSVAYGVQGAFNMMQQAASSALSSIQSAVSSAWNAITSATTSLWNLLTGHSIWPDMMDTMQSITETTMASIEGTVISGFASTVASAQASFAQLQGLQQQAASLAASIQSYVSPPGSAVDLQAVARAAGGHAVSVGGATMWIADTIAPPANISALGPAVVAAWREAYLQLNPLLGYQTEEGESRRIARTGLAEVHAGEVIGRPPGISSITLQNQIVVDGATVAKTVERRMIRQRQLAGGYS